MSWILLKTVAEFHQPQPQPYCLRFPNMATLQRINPFSLKSACKIPGLFPNFFQFTKHCNIFNNHHFICLNSEDEINAVLSGRNVSGTKKVLSMACNPLSANGFTMQCTTFYKQKKFSPTTLHLWVMTQIEYDSYVTKISIILVTYGVNYWVSIM